MAVSFASDIRLLFRESPEIDSMQGYGLDLSSYEEVKARAYEIYARFRWIVQPTGSRYMLAVLSSSRTVGCRRL
jgi:hypothetical protein